METPKTVWVLACWDLEESLKRALTIAGAWGTKQRAEEEHCYLYIKEAEQITEEEEEQKVPPHEKLGFYENLQSAVEDEDFQVWYIEEVELKLQKETP